MNIIKRSHDVISETQMEDLGGLKNFPIFMGCVNHSQDDDMYADMLWHISPNNGLLQLKELIPLEILYPENHSGAIGSIWMDHHKAFARFIKEYAPKSILEIGGAHGILSKLYIDDAKDISWTIIEPNPIANEGVKAKFIKGFFDDKFVMEEKVDAVVHSHVFEHVYDPNTFIKNISKFLCDGQHLLFTLPNMKEMLIKKYTNCINFEHTVFLTEPYIEYLLSKHGFKILKHEYFLDDHSIFYACVRDTSISPINIQSDLYEQNKKIYLDFVDYHSDLIKDINDKTSKLNINQSLFLFGAHVFAQYLIAFGLNTSNIECLLDNDPNKQGKRLYGTNLQVASPKILANKSNPVVILKAGAYNNEIKKDILDNINESTIFIE